MAESKYYLLGVLAVVLLGYGVGQSLPPAIDWETAYYPATQTMLAGAF